MNQENDPNRTYQSVWTTRYAGRAMRENFSAHRKFSLWRDLWIALAEAQRELGLKIEASQVEAMRRAAPDIDLDRAAAKEAELRHDVMAHLHTFAEACPEARPIIHLGATSCFVADNAELIQVRDGLGLLIENAAATIHELAGFARRTRAIPTLGYTHFQPAQPTTVGKRACLWIQDLLLDLHELERRRVALPFRGAKGTTGTQASFLALFAGDEEKVRRLDAEVARRMGFERTLTITGQTYPRKIDFLVLSAVAGIGVSAEKFGSDMRLLAHEREIEEPLEAKQVGSSAMPYKRNPMRSERICSLSRYLTALQINPAITAAHQWLERSLDDSANRRLVMPESFLAADAILRLWRNVARGLVVNEKVIEHHLDRELPFMATEELLMQAVARGGDRQALHERIRVHARQAAERLKQGAEHNDLLERIRKDPAFASVCDRLDDVMQPERFIGRAPSQVDEFLRDEVAPAVAGLGEDAGSVDLAV